MRWSNIPTQLVDLENFFRKFQREGIKKNKKKSQKKPTLFQMPLGYRIILISKVILNNGFDLDY